jgi:hypothetical protein
MLSVFSAIGASEQRDGSTARNGAAAAALGVPAASPTHAKNLSPRPPVSNAASKDKKNLSASLADCHSFPECSPAQIGQRGSPKPDKIYTFLPAWKKKSLNEIERIKRKGSRGGALGLSKSSWTLPFRFKTEAGCVGQMMKSPRQVPVLLLW